MTMTATSTDHAHAMQCLEVWGGNQAIQTEVSVPGIDAWISSIPYRGEADGGDVHYLSMCGAGRVSRFALADVSGHGDAVGELGGRLHKLMRKYIGTPDQTAFARAINDEFSKLSDRGQFATALLATYFAPTHHLIVCNLGHPRAMRFNAFTGTWAWLSQGMVRRIPDMHNLPLGIIEGTQYVQFAVPLGQGDVVVVYTDSLSEAMSPQGDMLGAEGLLELVRLSPIGAPAGLGLSILSAVAAYRGGGVPDDDETLLVLHHNATPPPKQSAGEKLRVMARMLGLGLGGD